MKSKQKESPFKKVTEGNETKLSPEIVFMH